MSTRTCVIDANACGVGLSVDDSMLQITTIADALSSGRAVHGDVPAFSGEFAFECYVWTVSRVALGARVAIGIAKPTDTLDHEIGSSADSYGYRIGDGTVRNNSSTLVTVQTATERTCIGVRVSLAPGAASVSWYVAGTLVHTQSLPTGQAWVPAVTISGGNAGDISAWFNFGQNRWDCFESDVKGWTVGTPGVSTLHLSHALEGFLDADNTAFSPRVLQPEQFKITKAPRPWWQSGGAASSYGSLRLDNSDGALSELVLGDTRDTSVVVSRIVATDGSGDTADAVTQCTAIIDSVSQSGTSIDVRLRSTLARLDKTLPCRVIPPFADESSAGRIYPVALGAQRLVQPLLFDAPSRTYILGDAPMTNVAVVSDGGAALSPNATPPQWQTAMGGRAIALETDPVMRLSVDCSTVGSQYEIPGAADALGGIGAFDPWAVTVGVATSTPPTGWVVSDHSGSRTLKKLSGTPAVAQLLTTETWYPPTSHFGDWLRTDSAILEAGRAYRLTCKFNAVYTRVSSNGYPGGFMLRMETGTSVTNDTAGAITPHGQPIGERPQGTYAIDFRVPEGANRYLFFCVAASQNGVPSPPGLQCGVEVSDIKLELLGQYMTLPLEGISLTGAFDEILSRAGESQSTWSRADTQAIDAATGYKIGLRWESAPTVLQALQEACDQFGAVICEDATGTIRVRQIGMPGVPIATFDNTTVIAGSVRIRPSASPMLTTLFGARKNQTPFAPGDFVTDTVAVTAAHREAWQRQTQYLLSSPVALADEYRHAQGAARQVLTHDDRATAQAEANRVVGMHSARAAEIEFTSAFIGNLPGGSTAPEDLLPGDTVTVDLPDFGFDSALGVVTSIVLSPFAGSITLTVRVSA